MRKKSKKAKLSYDYHGGLSCIDQAEIPLRLITTRVFLFFYFLRDQNSQHFTEDLLVVNASALSFVLCFKAIDYVGASNYVISAK